MGREPCTPIPKAIAKEDILWAADQIDRGINHEFGAPTRYAVVIKGKEYPSKAVVLRRLLGLMAEGVEDAYMPL